MNSFNQEYTTIWSFKERGQWATHKGDATKLTLQDKSVDFICTHPPYMDIIKYSNGINGDISCFSKRLF